MLRSSYKGSHVEVWNYVEVYRANRRLVCGASSRSVMEKKRGDDTLSALAYDKVGKIGDRIGTKPTPRKTESD